MNTQNFTTPPATNQALDFTLDDVAELDYNAGPTITVNHAQAAQTARVDVKALHGRPSIAEQSKRLLAHLHRGGNVIALWRGDNKQSLWFDATDDKRTISQSLMRDVDLYFSVNPLRERPPTSKKGNTNPLYIRSQIAYISGINSLYAEYDGKDFVEPDEYAPYLPSDYDALDTRGRFAALSDVVEKAFDADIAKYKARAKTHVDGLPCTPSVIIDSGSGYQCYWLLRDTVTITDDNREEVRAAQAAWVGMVGGDTGAKDLTRVLRLPGTRNHKKRFGDNKPLVPFVSADFDCLYDFAELRTMAQAWEAAQQPATTEKQTAQTTQRTQPPKRPAYVGSGETIETGEVRTAFNKANNLVALLVSHGYTICSTGNSSGITALARPGRDAGQRSVDVYQATADTPEISVHYSGSDALKTDKKGRDCFSAYAHLDHNGDYEAAWVAAKKSLGLWEEPKIPEPQPIVDTATGEVLPLDECLRRMKMVIDGHRFKTPMHHRAAIGIMQRMERAQTTQVRMSKANLSDLVGAGDTAAQNAIRWSCPEAMQAHRNRLAWQLSERQKDLGKAIALRSDADALFQSLSESTRTTITARVEKQRHESPDVTVEPVAVALDYLAERRDKIAAEITSIEKGIAEGRLLPLLLLVRAGRAGWDGWCAVYALNPKPLNSESFRPYTYNSLVSSIWSETFTISDFVGEHMTEDAFSRNVPRTRVSVLREETGSPATSLANAQLAKNAPHRLDGHRYRTDENGEIVADESPNEMLFNYALDSFGHHAPVVIYHARESGPLPVGELAALAGVSLPTLRKLLKRMAESAEAAGHEPLLEVHKDGRKKIVSLPDDWQKRLGRLRVDLRQDGMIDNRVRKHITERLIKLDSVLGIVDSPGERQLLLSATENTGNLAQFISGENVYDMVEASRELADVEDAISRMGGKAAFAELRERAAAAIELQSEPATDAITPENVHDHLLQVSAEEGEEGEAAHRLLDLDGKENLTYAERFEMAGLAELLNVRQGFEGGIDRADAALAMDVLDGTIEAVDVYAEAPAQPEPSPEPTTPAIQTLPMF